MRWSNLTIDEDERAQLPGYRDGAVIRHFEAPGAIRTRFYEVRAKSVLNRVPESSQMPFRWTINPYRGCTHGCTFCLGGETAVLMADGSSRLIADLGVGEEIIGTDGRGQQRRYVRTVVRDKWSSIKPAWAVELEDGTELIASGEHRFLSRRGWKYVTGAVSGPLRRPHLTARSRLLGPGGHLVPPIDEADYRRGYLAGIAREDGVLERDGGGTRVDREAVTRARRYLTGFGIGTAASAAASGGGAEIDTRGAIQTGSGAAQRIRELIRWPLLPTEAWSKGFLAAAFDAGGCCRRGVLRIAWRDAERLNWTVICLHRFGFRTVRERDPNGSAIVRVIGGMAERMRFFNLAGPAAPRDRSIAGAAVEDAGANRVVAIRELGFVMRMYDITTGSGDFVANGVISHNCFARPTHKYLDFDPGEDFEREIVVKVNAPEVLRAELARPSWRREHVALGTNTDPYQWVEGRYRLMPAIWEALRDARNECSVLTKSPLLLRDLALMKEIDDRAGFGAALSIPTLDEQAWRATEPHTPNPRARLEAVAELTRAGIRTGVLIAPLMPGINDAPEQVEEILQLAHDAGADYVTGIALHLRQDVRRLFFEWLQDHRPELVSRYQRLYRHGAYAPPAERARLTALLKRPEAKNSDWMRGGRRPRPLEREEGCEPPRAPQQGVLF